MSNKKAFIGYDLGDGETITDFVVMDLEEPTASIFKDMEMPDSNSPGQAIPTAYGYNEEQDVVFASSILEAPEEIQQIHNNFKRCPSDLMGALDDEHRMALLPLFEAGWPSQEECPEVYTQEMQLFRNSVISFTNAIFENAKYADRVRSEVINCDEIVFCIGHPTKWDDLDVAIYKSILSASVLGKGAYLGKPSSIVMEKESRAAYLYVKDKTHESSLPMGTLALLIDIGSSTIDLTALTSDSRNYQYNSGSKNLGARSIDFLIRDWYLENLKEDEMDWVTYQELIRSNPTMDNALSLCCRKAKEKIYSTSAKKTKIVFADFAPVRISETEISDLVTSRPIGKVLQKWADLSPEMAEAMGDKSWTEMFHEFLTERKAEMDADHIKIGRIILTGSASKMPFISEIVRDVFPDVEEDSILNDMNPSRSISMGLALVGPSNEKSKGFQEDMRHLIDTEIPQCVEKVMPELADSLSKVIEHIIINQIVKEKMRQWKSGVYKTLDDMTEAIKEACTKENLNKTLQNDKAYNDAINQWAVEIVGKEIALKLHDVCKKYHVSEFTVDDLNVMQVSDISVNGVGELTPMEGLMKAIVAVLSVIAGIITAVVLPTVLGIVVGLISFISVDIAIILLDILLMLPGIGWTILLGFAGIAVIMAASKGLGNAKDELVKKIRKVDLPSVARNMMTDDKIDKKLKEANLQKQIYDSILQEDSKKEIAKSVAEGLKKQIQQKADEIKYIIESK